METRGMEYKPSSLTDSTLKAMVNAYAKEYCFVTTSTQRSILKRLRYMNKLLERQVTKGDKSNE